MLLLIFCFVPNFQFSILSASTVAKQRHQITMSAEDQSYHIDFHGIQYVLSLLVASTSNSNQSKTLLIDIEQTQSGARWCGEFNSKYIEDITNKTGNFKRFSVFVNMLRKALDSGSESVFVDLLTGADLTELKNRRSGKPSGIGTNTSLTGSLLNSSRSSSSSRNNGKRYLILTYTAEFDKVHYPLPLAFEDNPSPATLQRTIGRLRREIANGNGNGTKLSTTNGNNGNGVEMTRQLHVLRTENEALKRNKGNAAAVEARIAFQKYRETSDMEISQLKKDCKSLASKLRDSRTKQDQAEYRYEKERTTTKGSSSDSKQIRALERKNAALRQTIQREKDSSKRNKSTNERKIMKMKSEIKNTKSQITRMRMELREANKRVATAKSQANRSVSRGRSTTPRSIGRTSRRSTKTSRVSTSRDSRDRGNRGRSTSSTRSGMNSVNSSRSSINTSTNSRLSRNSDRSIRSTRSARSTRSTRSTRSSNYGQTSQSRKPRKVRKIKRTPSPSIGRTNRSSTGGSRRSNISNISSGSRNSGSRNSGNRGRSATTRTRTRRATNGSTSAGRRSKRHPSPFQYNSSGSGRDSRSSSIESRNSEKGMRTIGGTNRRTRMAKTKASKKKTKKKKKSTTNTTNGIPRAPSTSVAKNMPIPPTITENSAIMGNVETSLQDLETSMEVTALAASRLEENTTETNFNANSEMADIDRRLNALQDFLKQAKTNAV